jgi:hypothetical protein
MVISTSLIAVFLKFGNKIDQFHPMKRRLKQFGMTSLVGVGFMEFFYENKLLSENLPEGFYKYQYQKFAESKGAKLNLSYEEVDHYWETNDKEYNWRYGYKGIG